MATNEDKTFYRTWLSRIEADAWRGAERQLSTRLLLIPFRGSPEPDVYRPAHTVCLLFEELVPIGNVDRRAAITIQ